jgi:UDP-glucose 4-epimerase
VIAQHGVESIIHFAGSVVVPDSMRDPLGYYRNNTMTTRSLLNAAVKSGVKRFIFSSTAAVYGNPGAGAGAGKCADPAAVALRLLQAHDRDHAA